MTQSPARKIRQRASPAPDAAGPVAPAYRPDVGAFWLLGMLAVVTFGCTIFFYSLF